MAKHYEYINPSMIVPDLEANTRDAAIEELAGLLEQENKITSKHTFIQSVLQREALASTYCGMDTAIPHAVSPAVKEPSFCFGRSPGFNWDSTGEPVRFVILLAVPEVTGGQESEHIEILSSISRLVLEEDVRQLWGTAQTKEEILASLRPRSTSTGSPGNTSEPPS